MSVSQGRKKRDALPDLRCAARLMRRASLRACVAATAAVAAELIYPARGWIGRSP